ncbi:hypothetical protein [Lihuaxuella thermophila]|uniref:Uncharacterized protein n=1 Tax=Lihuaxuella thermophila TaxID=1173111 RepID=A0A1H8E9P7_9BACL|nr:hypothetical protein [Lihuaxuella thermophila]SEN16120.1 hypothetical protein SAMN05444955_106206 [Lihuaxuella thermophila]
MKRLGIFFLVLFVEMAVAFGLDLIQGFSLVKAAQRFFNPFWVIGPVEKFFIIAYFVLTFVWLVWPVQRKA